MFIHKPHQGYVTFHNAIILVITQERQETETKNVDGKGVKSEAFATLFRESIKSYLQSEEL